ncbi:Exosome complex component rrp40 [Oopsacas minuta]|uniref:Exosome complex component rrp40 n=1 Tax=Oopsacas minuta TaxID=111878 RepID=A0AAV7K7G5_9METZ|nr:Exosome complex component rrp40 [Oopsacas minuta]
MECVHRSGKARLMGQLEEGYMVRCPLHVTRSLLVKDSPLLHLLQDNYTFEIAVGMNGRVWLDTSKIKDMVKLVNLIQDSEFSSMEQLGEAIRSKKFE